MNYTHLINSLPSLSLSELLDIKNEVNKYIKAKSEKSKGLMRSANEYFEATQEARYEGEEHLPLSAEWLANGRQFTLTKSQVAVIEGDVGRLASRDVTVYNVALDGDGVTPLSFSIQCNANAKSCRVVGWHCRNAKKFFERCAAKQDELEMEESTTAKPSTTSKSSAAASKKAKLIAEIMEEF